MAGTLLKDMEVAHRADGEATGQAQESGEQSNRSLSGRKSRAILWSPARGIA